MYNTYLLLDFNKELLAGELREVINFGDAVILIKTKPGDDTGLEDVFGVKFKGELEEKDPIVQLPDSPISNEGTLDTEGKAVKLALDSESAKIYGYIPDEHGTHPVIVYNEYGRGRAILYAFDLLSAPDQAQAAALLIDGINRVRSAEYHQTALGNAPVKIKVLNSTEQADIKVIEKIPEGGGAGAITPEPSEQTENSITWEKSLSANDTAAFKYELGLPDRSGDFVTKTEVWYDNLGEYRLYGSYELTLSVQHSGGELLQSAISDLETMLSSQNGTTDAEDDEEEDGEDDDRGDDEGDAGLIGSAVKQLKKVDADADDLKDAGKNIGRIIKAIGKVLKLSIDSAELRLKLDEMLKVWERKWHGLEAK